MKTMIKKNTTLHASKDRINRWAFISQTVGYGEIVCRRYHIDEQGRPAYKCITDTGVLVVLNKDNDIVTFYIATFEQIAWVYNDKAVPSWLSKIAYKNKRLIPYQDKNLDDKAIRALLKKK